MTSTDWAAWVQALGSIAAIIAAIWISKNQSDKDRISREEEAKSRYIKQRNSILIFMQTIAFQLLELSRSTRSWISNDLNPHEMNRIKDWMEASKNFPLNELNINEIDAYLQMRAIAVSAILDKGMSRQQAHEFFLAAETILKDFESQDANHSVTPEPADKPDSIQT